MNVYMNVFAGPAVGEPSDLNPATHLQGSVRRAGTVLPGRDPPASQARGPRDGGYGSRRYGHERLPVLHHHRRRARLPGRETHPVRRGVP